MNEFTRDFKELVLDYAIDKLYELDYEDFSIYGADLHNELFNTDYVVIGTYRATQEIEENIHNLLTTLQRYKDEFGEAYGDITNAEKVLNLMYYMCGNDIMSNIELFNDDTKWNGLIDNDDIKLIIKEMEAMK